MSGCGAAVARDEDGAKAAGEAVRAALAQLGGPAETLFLFASAAYGDPRPILRAAAEAGGAAAAIVGGCGSGVLAGTTEVEDDPAVAVLALGAGVARVSPFLASPGERVALPDGGSARGRLGLAFVDGMGTPERALAGLPASWGRATPCAGPVVVGTEGPRPAYRWVGGEIAAQGVAGALVQAEDSVVVVAQGCRPIGRTCTVTASTGNVLETIDGRPAFEAFTERARPLAADLRRASQHVFLGVSGVPGAPESGDEDSWVVRGLLGFDPDRGLLASSEPLPPGSRVRFVVRDAQAARGELRAALARAQTALGGRPPRFGFYFAGSGRGAELYGIPDHDVCFIQGTLGDFPLVGMFGGGELGPGAGGTRLHLFSGVLALVR